MSDSMSDSMSYSMSDSMSDLRHDLVILIMAGGMGKRMESDLPKVLHCISEKPMLFHVIEKSIQLNPKKIGIIVGKFREIIIKTIKLYFSEEIFHKYFEFIDQSAPQGTGHAIQCCRDLLGQYTESNVLILSGDVPLIQPETMDKLIKYLNDDYCALIVNNNDNPYGYGRIIANDQQEFCKIVEEKDCSKDERLVTLVNSGIYAFQATILYKYLPYLNNNNSQKEYYLTDIIKIIKDNEKCNINMYVMPKESEYEVMGVNTKQQLELLKTYL